MNWLLIYKRTLIILHVIIALIAGGFAVEFWHLKKGNNKGSLEQLHDNLPDFKWTLTVENPKVGKK